MPPLPINIPRQITAGDTLVWRDNFSDYKPPQYILSWAIRGAASLNLTSVADGDDFITTLTAAASSTLIPGAYFFQAYTAKTGGERTTIGSGQITVIANLETIFGAYNGSSTAEKMLTAVEKAIAARLEGGAVDSYEIRGRSLARTPLPELIALRANLRIEVARERSAAGLMPDARRLHIRFRSPS